MRQLLRWGGALVSPIPLGKLVSPLAVVPPCYSLTYLSCWKLPQEILSLLPCKGRVLMGLGVCGLGGGRSLGGLIGVRSGWGGVVEVGGRRDVRGSGVWCWEPKEKINTSSPPVVGQVGTAASAAPLLGSGNRPTTAPTSLLLRPSKLRLPPPIKLTPEKCAQRRAP